MKFDICHYVLLSSSFLSFSAIAADLNRKSHHGAVHILGRASPITNGTSVRSSIPPSSHPSEVPTSRGPSPAPTNPPMTTLPVSSTTTTSVAPATTTVSDGATVIVAAGKNCGGGAWRCLLHGRRLGGSACCRRGWRNRNSQFSKGGRQPNDTIKPPSSVPTSNPPKSTASTSTSFTSSVPSGTPTPCLIFPKDGATRQEKKDFISLLDKELGKGNYRETEDLTVLFVSADVTSTQQRTISSNPLVGGIEPVVQFDTNTGKSVPVPNSKRDEDVHEKWWMESLDKLGRIRKRAVVKQDNAPTELIMFSQPPLVDLAALKSYTYDDSAGTGTTVYVVDTGYYTKNSEYTRMAVKPRWLFGGSQSAKSVKEDVDPGGHGSCAGSKVNGPKYGVAKQVNLVIVKASTNSDDTLDALNQVLADIRKNNLQGKAVVNFSRSLDNPSPFQKKMIEYYVKEMIREDVIFITASGNDDRDEVYDGKVAALDVDAWPALMAAAGVPIINVGAVDNTGKNASFSQGGSLVHVMAPGVQVQCAANSFFFGTQKLDGTSYAAPSVAGLAAYLLALGEHPELYQAGKVAENMKKILVDMAYQRVPGGGQVAFNGQGAVSSRRSSAKFKRQDLSGEACSAKRSLQWWGCLAGDVGALLAGELTVAARIQAAAITDVLFSVGARHVSEISAVASGQATAVDPPVSRDGPEPDAAEDVPAVAVDVDGGDSGNGAGQDIGAVHVG
ncbi:peptidase S8/S53 domain-containing protein [Colletotrichum navitas]|uniref:Peptidase S8/S53 domain-containing protein n=1 Tax=Colletotrichum navitas TaxID=681940 RepID=A0AAD8PJD3_9PEZI|nr:peptidase S8/S53 domain-containing protein [Colletotrichum navitas]KAK1561718.1 peptidase S8/S53 domain-containing protein [Colletotrichum navitas]